MSLQVRRFQIENRKGECLWKFKLGNNSMNQVDFYTEDESARSLFHLAQDMDHLIQGAIDRKKKKMQPKNRAIRKVCEKMIKSLNLTLKIFAHDIREEPQNVLKYFEKKELSEDVHQRIQKKCQRWVIEVWVRIFN